MESDINTEHPLFRLIIQSMLVVPNIEQVSFDGHNPLNYPCTQEFIDSLEEIEITDKDITCSICLDTFETGDKVHKLSCNHYFHSDCETCPGIIPWLQKNHTCPVCRTEFPKGEPLETEREETLSLDNEGIPGFHEILSNMDVIRDGYSDRDMDEAMRRSLEE